MICTILRGSKKHFTLITKSMIELPTGHQNDMDIPTKLGYLIKPMNMIPYKTWIARGILLAFILMVCFAGTKGKVSWHDKVSYAVKY